GLMKRMPVEAVMRMAFVGRHERMSAARAYELGMVGEVVDPPDRLRAAAQELAEKIARNSPAAMAATKRAMWGALELGLTDACRAPRTACSPGAIICIPRCTATAVRCGATTGRRLPSRSIMGSRG